MRILIITPYPSGPIFGGVEAVAEVLVPSLSRHPDIEQVNVVSLHYGPEDFTERRLVKGFHYAITSKDRFELLTGRRGDIERVRALCDRIHPDIVHAQGLGREGVLAVQSRRLSVVTVHGLIHVERSLRNPYPNPIQKIKIRLADRLLDLVLKRANLIISTSRYDREALKIKVKGPCVSIPNPVSEDFFKIMPVGNDPIVLFTGVVQPRKNVLGIVRAFRDVAKQIPLARLNIVGPTPDPSYKDLVKREILSLGINNHVFWSGHISHTQMLSEYARCALMVMFSVEETSPMAIAQALAAGKPVVASNVGGISEMVLEGENGHLTSKGDEYMLAQGIIELLKDNQIRSKMGRRSREIAIDRYHPNKVVQKTIAAYHSLLEGDLPV